MTTRRRSSVSSKRSRTSTTSRRSTPTSTSQSRCFSTPSAGTVLGIDPGTTGMGYALLAEHTDPPRLLACGLVEVSRELSTAARLLAIANALDALIAEHRPTALALERLYFNKNVKTAMAVSEARGVALLCGARAGMAISEYTPQEVKQSVTGSGGSDKKAVQRLLVHILKLDAPITDDNIADAVAVALTHSQRARFAAAVAMAK
ncbi:MAG TPA: crossover junction endodeoxyribonuclease RuvC [Candidatus Limnocylindrales bacterium]|nr:crossover junction endodeoxyribonuclease RuvC [Candidatus Limnocylindrales bacterium]